jgi:hypothetical protein
MAVLLSACHVSPPGIPLSAVPSDPLVQALQQHRSSFTGMKGIARIETDHRGRKRAYESVAIVLKGQDRFRVEGYGPLGETLFTVVWDGTDIFLKRAEDENAHKTGQFGFERMLGVSLSPADLCAILSGNIPAMPADAETSARCSQVGWCLVDFRYDNLQWQVKVVPPQSAQESIVIESMELFRNRKEVFFSSYVYKDNDWPRQFPAAVVLAQKDRNGSLLVQYQDVDVNVPLADSIFSMGEERRDE